MPFFFLADTNLLFFQCLLSVRLFKLEEEGGRTYWQVSPNPFKKVLGKYLHWAMTSSYQFLSIASVNLRSNAM
jgi:hypothetical protein